MTTQNKYASKNKSSISSINGFSLVEVLVAIAILSVISFGISSVLINSIKSDVAFRARMEGNELRTELTAMMKMDACGSQDIRNQINLTANPATDWAANKKYNLSRGLKSPFLTVKGSVLGSPDEMYGKLKIESVEISGYFNKNTNTTSYTILTPTQVKASVSVTLSSKSTSLAALEFPIVLTLNPTANKIVDCQTEQTNDASDALCSDTLGGTLDETGKCILPCPSGMESLDGICVTPAGDEQFCPADDPCNIQPKYKWPYIP